MIISGKQELELERIAALRRYEILDTPAEKDFDDLLRIAASIAEVPIAMISLIDEDRCWFKARMGWEEPEMSRTVPFSRYALNQHSGILIVEDLQENIDFSGDPSMPQNPPLRFYANVPLQSPEGHTLGALWLFDLIPRVLLPHQIESLQTIGRQVVVLLELRRQTSLAKELSTQLTALNHELQAFNYSIAHDLRGPLRGIKGFAELITEDYSSQFDDTCSEMFGYVLQSAQKMEDIINDLLILSRISTAQTIDVGLDLTKICQDILVNRSLPPKYKVVVQENLIAQGDPKQIRQVLECLLDNAVKFSGNEDQPRMEVGQVNTDGEIKYFVKDNGVGFDLQTAARIFQPFQRLHSESEFEGSGMGLAFVQKIIRRHGGRVWAESSLGEGSTFYFTLGQRSI